MAKPGRILKLTPALHKAIVKGVGEGLPYKFAAQKAGASERSMMRWMAVGRHAADESGPHWQFWHDVKKAESGRVAKELRHVTRASRKTWQAAAWYLERRHDDEFGSGKREIQDLRKQLAQVVTALGQLAGKADVRPERTPAPPVGDGPAPGATEALPPAGPPPRGPGRGPLPDVPLDGA